MTSVPFAAKVCYRTAYAGHINPPHTQSLGVGHDSAGTDCLCSGLSSLGSGFWVEGFNHLVSHYLHRCALEVSGS